MTMHIKTGGAWREIRDGIRVKVSGTWRTVTYGWVKVSGTWRQFYVRDSDGPVTPTPSASWNQGIPGFTVSYGATTDAASGVASVTLQVLFQGGSWTNVGAVSSGGGSTNHAVPNGNRGQTVGYRLVSVDNVGNTTYGTAAYFTARPLGSFGLAAIDSGTYAQHKNGSSSGAAGWRSTYFLYSGRWDSATYGYQVGFWFYGTGIADICKGYAPDVVAIYAKRYLSYGAAGHPNYLAPHDHTTKPLGAPTLGGGSYLPGDPPTYPNEDPIGPTLDGSDGEENYQLPGSWMALFGNGTLKGIATVDSKQGQEGSLGSYRQLRGIDTEGLSGFLTIQFT